MTQSTTGLRRSLHGLALYGTIYTQRRRRMPSIATALGLLLLGFSPANGGGDEDNQQLRRKIDDLEAELALLKQINARLTLSNSGGDDGGGSNTAQCVNPCLRKVKAKKCRRCFEAVITEAQHLGNVIENSYLVAQQFELPFSRVHPSIPEPTIGVPHHLFTERPPHIHGKRPPSDNKTVARYQKHASCPALRARSKVQGLTVRFPYTARFYRDGAVEVTCEWIKGAPVKRWEVNHPTVRQLRFFGGKRVRSPIIPPPPNPTPSHITPFLGEYLVYSQFAHHSRDRLKSLCWELVSKCTHLRPRCHELCSGNSEP